MDLTRREFTAALPGLVGASGATGSTLDSGVTDPCNLPAPIRSLSSMTGGVAPIGDGERRDRIAKAQRLMTDQGIGALVIEPAASMYYFTGVRWSLSERTFAMVLPAKGELA
jgi:Xaa-Pro dipeptidase